MTCSVLIRWFLVTIVATMLALGAHRTAYCIDDEYMLKAAFIEGFTKFITWPDSSAMNDSAKSCVIGIYGENPFGTALETYFKKQKINNKKVIIKEIDTPQKANECDIVFVGPDKDESIPHLAKLATHIPILLISDTKGFGEKGVHINLYVLRNKIRFEINEAQIRNSPLKFSSLLLDNAKLVKSKKID